MNRKKAIRITAMLLTALLICSLAACSGKTRKAEVTPAGNTGAADAVNPQSSPAGQTDANAGQTSAPADPEPSPEPSQPAVDPAPQGGGEGEIKTGPDGAYHVSSIDQLIEAIEPGANITLEEGEYNLSDYVVPLRSQVIFDRWCEEHPYLYINSVYDGAELVIQNCDDLWIEGGTDDRSDTELVTDPRYAAVLRFENCNNLTLIDLTAGHTENGDCTGNVFDFRNCKNIDLHNMDIYGCGVYGISAYLCEDVCVTNCNIHDCEYGPFDIAYCKGEFLFENCSLTGSGSGGSYDFARGCGLSFTDCRFGQKESNIWYFAEGVEFWNCEWSEVTEYPDYSGFEDSVPDFEPENMRSLSLTADDIGYSFWVGYSVTNQQSGATEYLTASGREDAQDEYAALWIDGDGTARLEYRGETEDLEWEMNNSQISFTGAENNFYATVYGLNIGADEYVWWLAAQYNETLIWFY